MKERKDQSQKDEQHQKSTERQRERSNDLVASFPPLQLSLRHPRLGPILGLQRRVLIRLRDLGAPADSRSGRRGSRRRSGRHVGRERRLGSDSVERQVRGNNQRLCSDNPRSIGKEKSSPCSVFVKQERYRRAGQGEEGDERTGPGVTQIDVLRKKSDKHG